MTSPDKSNGYEAIAPIFIAGRGRSLSGVGASHVAEWSRLLPNGATVLDLGCGTGLPITHTLVERGFNLYGVDASASMVAAFQTNFPTIPVLSACVEDSDFFGRTYDGVVSWGLFFLLEVEMQRRLIAKIASVLTSGGRLLFTATRQSCTWQDVMTKRLSISLGHDAYRVALEASGLSLVETVIDGGENYYYSALKT